MLLLIQSLNGGYEAGGQGCQVLAKLQPLTKVLRNLTKRQGKSDLKIATQVTLFMGQNHIH